jgi:hypothetical protein
MIVSSATSLSYRFTSRFNQHFWHNCQTLDRVSGSGRIVGFKQKEGETGVSPLTLFCSCMRRWTFWLCRRQSFMAEAAASAANQLFRLRMPYISPLRFFLACHVIVNHAGLLTEGA